MSKTCSSCNKTFDDSMVTCPNCMIALVPVEQKSVKGENEIKQISVFSLTSENSAQRVIEYMKEQGVEGEYRYSLREKTFKIYVAEHDARNALRACTSFYAVEAKRLKAEEDKIREAEESRRRAEEEEKRRIEEEERRKREEEEAKKRAEEEAERLKREAIEAEKRAEEEAAIQKAEEEAHLKAEEAERIRLEAEDALRKAEQTAKFIEEEAKRAAEEEERLKREAEENEKRKAREEKERQVLEEKRRVEEEKERKRAESERRRSIFARGIREAEAERLEKKKIRFGNIPHVEGETVEEKKQSSSEDSFVPENGPIFVETEPVAEYEVGDTITVDAVEIDVSEAYEDADAFYDHTSEEEPDFSDLFTGINKTKTKTNSSLFSSSDDNQEDDTQLFTDSSEQSQEPFVEDMFTNNVFTSEEKNTKVKSFASNEIYEEVINDELKSDDNPSSSYKAPQSKFAEKFANLNSIDDGTYKGFVPDFHAESDEEDEDIIIAKSYGFDPEEYKKLKESTAKKAQDRKHNPPPRKRPENKEFIMMEEVPADDYRGFVPDYSQRKEQEKMDYYSNRTTIDYSKYKTSGGNERNTLTELTSTLRSTSQTELSKLFENNVIQTATKPQDFIALKSSNYLLALTGGQLNSLFSAWLMTNCTSATVKQYVKDSATPDENYKNKIEGIKNLLKQNFGKLDDAALDIIVKKFYNKYLDE